MNKKISLGLAVSLIIVAITASFAITMTVSRQMYNRLIVDLPNRIAQYEVVAEIDSLMRANYFNYDKIDQNILSSKLADGYMRGMNDPSCFFMTAEECDIYTKKLEGNLPGIGITHTLDSKTGYILISEVATNSPADAARLEKGDEIIKVDNKTVTAANYVTLSAKLEGNRLKTVDITYRRKGKDKNINVMIGYPAQTVYYEASDNIGYVKITAFFKNTVDQFNKAINDLEKQKVQSLIFDVRNCSEGDIQYAAKVIDTIVPVAADNTNGIVTVIDKNGKTIDTISSDSNNISMKMAVIINSKTSGCAELFAQDLKDFREYDVTLIGDKSAGIWTKQELFRLKDGNAVMMTVAKIMPYISDPFRNNKNGEGITPDIAVSLTPEQEKNLDQLDMADDIQIQTAFNTLREAQG